MKSLSDSHKLLYSQIGGRITAARKAAGISQVDLASKIGVSAGNLSNLERGMQRILVNSLLEIAEHLSVSALDLLPELHQKTPARGLSARDERILSGLVDYLDSATKADPVQS